MFRDDVRNLKSLTGFLSCNKQQQQQHFTSRLHPTSCCFHFQTEAPRVEKNFVCHSHRRLCRCMAETAPHRKNHPPNYSTMRLLLLATIACLCCNLSQAWTSKHVGSHRCVHQRQSTKTFPLLTLAAASAKGNNIDLDGFDDDDDTPKLGIDIGSMLEPLSESDAAELKAAATEIINDAIAAGLDDLDAVREQTKREIEEARRKMQRASERNAQVESERLLNKIDALTDDFLQKSAPSRRTTKLAAQADGAASGRGVQIGSWGSVGGVAVQTSGKGDSEKEQSSASDSNHDRRIAILADVSGDPYAKQLVSGLTERLQSVLSGDDHDDSLTVTVYKPTDTVPLAGDNCAAAIVFLTSFSSVPSLQNCLERLRRQTLVNGVLSRPPTQMVCISTVGTERTNKLPYSMANMMGGGKLENRRQMEEAVVRSVRDSDGSGSSVDYTVAKLGELVDAKKKPASFALSPGDTLDGTLEVDTALTVLTQAITLQSTARNATLSCVGMLDPTDGDAESSAQQAVLDDAFLRLDGPEVTRIDLDGSKTGNFDQLAEYVNEWASMLAETGQGLTTPIALESIDGNAPLPTQVSKQSGVRLVFLPTATGSNYMSKQEEKQRESQGGGRNSVSKQILSRTSKDGGVEFVVEVTSDDNLRVRAKRCNYGEKVIVKELSEQTILSSFRKSVEVWQRDH